MSPNLRAWPPPASRVHPPLPGRAKGREARGAASQGGDPGHLPEVRAAPSIVVSCPATKVAGEEFTSSAHASRSAIPYRRRVVLTRMAAAGRRLSRGRGAGRGARRLRGRLRQCSARRRPERRPLAHPGQIVEDCAPAPDDADRLPRDDGVLHAELGRHAHLREPVQRGRGKANRPWPCPRPCRDQNSVPAKLALDIGGYTGDYSILEVGSDEYAVVGHPSRLYLWVLGPHGDARREHDPGRPQPRADQSVRHVAESSTRPSPPPVSVPRRTRLSATLPPVLKTGCSAAGGPLDAGTAWPAALVVAALVARGRRRAGPA